MAYRCQSPQCTSLIFCVAPKRCLHDFSVSIMSGKRKQWHDYKERQGKRRVGAKSDKASPSASEGFLTVQRLSANVQGKCQKYNRIGPLTLVPFDKEPTFKNIKDACKSHFGTNCECDVLAGERGPSYTHESQIKDWSKVIHIRFLEYEKSQKAEEPVFVRPLHKSEPVSPRKCDSVATAVTKSSVIPRSVSLSQMLKVGQLIEPETNVVTLHLEEFAVNELKWLDPFPVALSLHRKSFSEGAFREAYMVKALSGLPKGDYVLKKYKEAFAFDLASSQHS